MFSHSERRCFHEVKDMSAQSLPAPPEGYDWEECLYTGEMIPVRRFNPIEDGIREAQIHLERFMQIPGWVAVNQGPINWAFLEYWDAIPQRPQSIPSAFGFHFMDHSFAFVRDIQANPQRLHDMVLFKVRHVEGLLTIRTIKDLHKFVSDFQNPHWVPRTPEEMIVHPGLCFCAPSKEEIYEALPDLYKVTAIQWNRVQDAGHFGWMIHPSLHEEAMKYSWYQKMGEPRTFVWDMRAFPNPTEDLERITFS